MSHNLTIAKISLAALVGFAALTASAFSQTAAAATRDHGKYYAGESFRFNNRFRWTDEGPFPERVLPDGTVTGPIPHSANGG